MPEHVPCPNRRRGRVNHVYPPFSERRRKTCWNKKKKQQKKAAISSTSSKLSTSSRTLTPTETSSCFLLITLRISHSSQTAEDLTFSAQHVSLRTRYGAGRGSYKDTQLVLKLRMEYFSQQSNSF